ncbi:MAG TPA: zinc ribbon-containing protein, partial [Gammaproteobacteria bacterium]|nr:zinc ribbon-containing protein [Gammaproteobacteria bacterium]
ETGEKKTVPWLREALANAREKAVELEELTREEAEKVSRYVERDLHEAASFIADTGQEFRDWLTFDWRLMQNRMLDMFAGMADQTSQALRGFAEQARQASQYHTGEVTAPGVLECSECGEILHFEKTGRIPPCPKCNATTFQRKPTAAP